MNFKKRLKLGLRCNDYIFWIKTIWIEFRLLFLQGYGQQGYGQAASWGTNAASQWNTGQTTNTSTANTGYGSYGNYGAQGGYGTK